jgi:membrane protein implicated in regulation of membrane protease activity
MSDTRIDAIVIAGGLLAWIGIFVMSAQGKLHVSGTVSDGVLALLAILIAWRLWRVVRHRSRKRV